MKQDDLDEILGITRCVRCGHRLNGEIECPFCAVVAERTQKALFPKWLLILMYFFSSPFSLYFIKNSERLNIPEKIISSSGCFFWMIIYFGWLQT
jgi:hypothetical protein